MYVYIYFIYIHTYTHIPPSQVKTIHALFYYFFCPKPKYCFLRTNWKWIFIFFRTVMLQNISCFILCRVSASKLISVSQAPPVSGNCNSASWCTYNQDKTLRKSKVARSANVTSFMDFKYLQSTILNFPFVQHIPHRKTTPSAVS